MGNRENISISCMIYYGALNSHATISSFITMAYDEVHSYQLKFFFRFSLAYQSEFSFLFFSLLQQTYANGKCWICSTFLVNLIDWIQNECSWCMSHISHISHIKHMNSLEREWFFSWIHLLHLSAIKW